MDILLVFLISAISSFALCSQTIPGDSLYLGQTPPGYVPKKFELPFSSGFFVAERITVSPDGTEIYYSELNGYPASSAKIRMFKYRNNAWNGPFDVFQNYVAPGFSPTGDTLFLSESPTNALYSVRNDTCWSLPSRFWNSSHRQHYLQRVNSGRYYLTSDPIISTNGDISELILRDSDTTIHNLGTPLNSASNGMDFFIDRDETYIIRVIKSGGIGSLYISYRNKEGGWTNPKAMGAQVNSSQGWEWGPYVTNDNRYLFFTCQFSSADISIYWVKVDNLIDSLRRTNFIPYIRNSIPNQTAARNSFFSYQIPDSTFIDDDGNHTLTYSATLSDGSSLPGWLSFDSRTRTFSGVPVSVGNLSIKVTVRDSASASVSCILAIAVSVPDGVKKSERLIPKEMRLYQNFPNPFNPTTTIHYSLAKPSFVRLIVYNLLGQRIRILRNKFQTAGEYSVVWDALDDRNMPVSSGVYFYCIEINNQPMRKKMVLTK
jgi:hypothetical protein